MPPLPADPRIAVPPGAVPPEPPRRRWWLAWRVLLGAIGVMAVSGAATAAIALNEVSGLTEALDQKPVEVAPGVLAPTRRGAPETLLLVGNDERAQTQHYHDAVLPHSNEMLLVRIDPGKPTISMLSIPRELWVPIVKPNGEVEENRINSAYTFGYIDGGGPAGGVKLMVETIKRVLGLSVNRVFVSNFHQFRQAVNEMGCVYMTVDKRYYHNNATEAEQYFEINLQPGYQRLCGREALEFVANRHESTSLIRDARDQRFLLEVKAQYGSSLLGNREKFERIFGKAVESANLDSEAQVLQLLELLIESAGKPVRQVPFEVTLHSVYDTATPEQIREAVSSFLSGTAAIHTAPVAPGHPHAGSHAHSQAPHATGSSISLTPTTADELAEARAQAPELPFPLEYPMARDSLGGSEPDELRVYHIHDQQGRLHPIYVVVIDRGKLGQYYDVQGTNWTDPPLLGSPGQTVQAGGRSYELFYAGEQVKTIAWREDGAVYWIENTLTNNVSPRAMLAMAEQTRPVVQAPSQPAASARAGDPAGRVNLAPRPAQAGMTFKLGDLLGLLGLLTVVGLGVVLVIRQRELRELREQVAHGLAVEARQRLVLTGVGDPAVMAEPQGAAVE